MSEPQLGKASIEELQVEIRRRQRRVVSLEKKRETLRARLAEVEAEIASLGGPAGVTGGGRARHKNDSNLADALAQVLAQKTLSVTEAAEAVRKAGYRTTSPNFRTIVNQTLLKDKRFKRVARGQYTASGSAGGSRKKRGRKKRS